jgi:hypothetical protein
MPDRLALYTFGVFKKPMSDPANDGFFALDERIFPLVDRAAGMIARSGYAEEPDKPMWGEHVFPRFYVERGDGTSPSTLSLWVDVEAAMAFAYFGLHAEALRQARSWFVDPDWPPYVAWWVSADHTPTWQEATQRLEQLHDSGPTAAAFSFKSPFDVNGCPITIDRDRVRRYADTNAANLKQSSPRM